MSEIIVAGLLRLDDWRTSRSCTSSTAGTLLAMRDGVVPPPSTWRCQTPAAIWITCPTTGAKSTGRPPEKKRRALGGKRPPVWAAEMPISPTDQVVKSGYILNFLHPYDVVRHGKVASRGKFQERRQPDGAPTLLPRPMALAIL